MTMKEAVARFRKYISVTKTNGTKSYYIFYLKVIENYYDDRDVNLIDGDSILDFIIHLKSNSPKIQNITINKFVGAIKTILKYSCNIEIKFQKLKEQKKIIPTISKEAQSKIFNYLQKRMGNKFSFRNYVLLRLMLDTGLRMNEVANLNIQDFDFLTNSIHVKVTKTANDRYVCFTYSTSQLLKKFVALTKPKNRFFFDFDTGKSMTTSSFECILYRLKTTLKIQESITPHKWRHTFATNFLKNGGDLETLRLLMGHTNLKTTQKYLHLSKQDIISNYNNAMRQTDIPESQ